jgi:hypothetical protein
VQKKYSFPIKASLFQCGTMSNENSGFSRFFCLMLFCRFLFLFAVLQKESFIPFSRSETIQAVGCSGCLAVVLWGGWSGQRMVSRLFGCFSPCGVWENSFPGLFGLNLFAKCRASMA